MNVPLVSQKPSPMYESFTSAQLNCMGDGAGSTIVVAVVVVVVVVVEEMTAAEEEVVVKCE